MTDEENLVYIRGMLLQAEIRMQGMVAENMQRELLGQSMAYTGVDFEKLIEEFGIYHNGLVTGLANGRI